MRCWILYERDDLSKNGFFAGRLRACGESLGMETSVVTTDAMPDMTPDVVVSRQRDWGVSR